MKKLLLLTELAPEDIHQPRVEVRQTGKREQKSKQEINECFVENEVELVCSHGAVDELWFYCG